MHLFRLRYTALGLLTFLQLVTSSAACCVYDFQNQEEEIASRTFTTTIVFEGLYHREYPSKDGQHVIKFKVLRMAKGGLPREPNKANKFHSVHVGNFGDAIDKQRCIANREHLEKGRKYLVFLNTTLAPRRARTRDSDRRKSFVSDSVNSARKSHFSGADRLPALPAFQAMLALQPLQAPVFIEEQLNRTYYLGSFPIPSTDKLFELVTRNNCTSCIRKPRITKISPDRKVLAGRKVRFQCRSSGYPVPEVNWYKNGNALHNEPGKMSKRMKNHTSILQIKNTSWEDSGSYQCEAVNMFGKSAGLNRTRLLVSTANENVFQLRCQRQNYCFNGGTCFELSKHIGRHYCECDGDYVGERCEQKNIGYNYIIRKKKKVPTATLR